MKKTLLILFALAILSPGIYGQSPVGIKYQALLKSPDGINLNNQELAVRFTIQQDSVGGTIVYDEMFLTSTNAYGLLNLGIGFGATTGDFSTIDWSNGPYFLETALNFLSGTPWIIMGTSEFLSVPYAFHANTADSLAGMNSQELDPVFTASFASSITAYDTAYWNSINDTDTQLDSTDIANFSFVAGPNTIDTDTQLDSLDIANFGFVTGPNTIDTDTQLDSLDIANFGFVTGPNTIDTDTQLDSLGIANFNYVAEKTYSIGLSPELGGYVFRISPNGKHGLVCETQVQSYSASWYGYDTLIKSPAYHSLDGQRFSDWRLPTKFELNEIYINRLNIGNLSNYCYWSSTEYDFGKAWKQNFGLYPTPGAQGLSGKSRISCGIISVRSF